MRRVAALLKNQRIFAEAVVCRRSCLLTLCRSFRVVLTLESMMPDVLIALGGNIGDVVATMRAAVERLDSLDQIEVLAKSRLYSTQPVGSAAGDAFVNAALTIRTDLEAVPLLDLLLNLEGELGRERSTPWGPRVIDLDLILYGEESISTDRLTVPHPCSFYRRFVLDPAIDIAAEWIHSSFGDSLSSIRNRLLQRPFLVCVNGDAEVKRELSQQQTEFEITESEDTAVLAFDATGTQPGPHVIRIHEVENRLAFVEQVLIAATDEPRCVGQL